MWNIVLFHIHISVSCPPLLKIKLRERHTEGDVFNMSRTILTVQVQSVFSNKPLILEQKP
jgi:hypothetical protein